MKHLVGAAAILLLTSVTGTALAQDAIPDLKGTWRGTGKILLFGTTEHLIGSPQNAVVRDLQVTHTVTGQDGRLLGGTTSSGNNDSKESEQPGQCVPTILAGACVGQNITCHRGQAECVVEFAIGQQS